MEISDTCRPEQLVPAGYLRDYISGQIVKATPEEIDAVQIFSRRLVMDYGYPKNHMQTHPQFHVRMRPSDEKKTYPVDIAVFHNEVKIEENLFMIVECKKKNKQEGIDQLKLYLDMSPTTIGVWFNGNEHVYLRKIHHMDGSRTYPEIPNIPNYGQRIEDIGLFKRRDLKKPSNLKAIFKDIRNHLAGMTTGITRDEALAKEIINVLFCKIFDEQKTAPSETVTFRAGVGETAQDVYGRILGIFNRVKVDLAEIFTSEDTIGLDPYSLQYVVGELQNYCVMDADRDAVGEAFEVFIGPALRGSEGQFFTPRNVIKMMVGILDPKPDEKILDPACGSGGFLICALEYVWNQLKHEAKRMEWSDRQLTKHEIETATSCFRGIDKDTFLAKVCKAYMALVGDGRGGVFCSNSLVRPDEWSYPLKEKIQLGSFDVILTNPPFGSKIVVKGESILSQYDLGHKWKKDKKTDTYEITSVLHVDQPPQILFLERCLQFLKNGGRLGIVLPESVLGNPSYEYIVTYLLDNFRILAVITMPESLFKTSGKGGTHTKVCVLLLQKSQINNPYNIFMAEAKWCGHDSRGNPTLRRLPSGEGVLLDDIPTILNRFKQMLSGEPVTYDHLGFFLSSDAIKNRILVPKYYNPEIELELDQLKATHDLISVGDLVKGKVLLIETGVEPGKMAYGTGKIPFVRTSDFSNWEIKADFKHGVSDEIYSSFCNSADVKPGDILLVRDGTYLIGTTAIVTESDIPMLFQSHIYRVRVKKEDTVNPWLLFACFNSPIVQRQIRSKQFTQDIIDTLGKRFLEIVLPIPKDLTVKNRISRQIQRIIQARVRLRNRTKQIVLELAGFHGVDDEDIVNIEN